MSAKRLIPGLLILVVAALAAWSGAAQTVFPTRYGSATAGGGSHLSGQGANGEIVDPYILTLESNSGGCFVAFVPVAEVITRCGDDDGCVLRLVSDTDSSGRVAGAQRSFVTDANGLDWTVSTGPSTFSSGTNANMTVTEIFEVTANNCTVWDDFQSFTPTDYELRVCANRSCTFRIDD